ncbi:hypothetical protein PHYSODRAFT_471769 [Phytophthora sojae]|uniref:Fibronectin type-III domain-containing protein n=1 Tax=Phytophthora sojae (strain P6497) TaxID=1094619 RepID=G4YGY9_PHYSP|nr:hypothetical protein PHYSODRAFT_471769 [Phytophthora sojae]EGZ27690.1 hypothetical protein PHYSODRAFT_471769 [Phytophthora sojae]|eukprot:XP_009514965.1 hypothetical protein PHYSODRAFT_471769 [Phytophthora sojae]
MAPVLVIATGTALNFQWSLPADTGGTLDLTYFVKVESSSSVGVNPSVGRSYNATQLVYSTVYSISVCAANIAGNGSWSPVLTAMTQPDTAGEFNFAQTSISVFENASQVAIAVQRVSGLSGQVTLTYTVGPTGTSLATVGSDYAVAKGSTATTGKIVFEPLQNQNNIVIFILNDALYENPDETFAVTIASVSSTLGVAKVGSNSKTTVTILDDGDAGFVSFESPTYSFSEGFPTATVTIIREYGKSSRISLVFEFSGGTATPDVDYRKTTTPVVMEDGVVQATLTFSIINDRVFEFPDDVTIAASTSFGNGNFSNVTLFSTTAPTLPGPITYMASEFRTGGRITFMWSPPDDTGGIPVTKYRVYMADTQGTKQVKWRYCMSFCSNLR